MTAAPASGPFSATVLSETSFQSSSVYVLLSSCPTCRTAARLPVMTTFLTFVLYTSQNIICDKGIVNFTLSW